MTQASCLEEGQKLLTITRTHNIPRTQPAHYGAPIYAIALGCDLKFAKEIGYTDQMINLKEPSLTRLVLAVTFANVKIVSKERYRVVRN